MLEVAHYGMELLRAFHPSDGIKLAKHFTLTIVNFIRLDQSENESLDKCREISFKHKKL